MAQRSTNKWLDPAAAERSGEVEGEERRRQNQTPELLLSPQLAAKKFSNKGLDPH